MLWDGDLNLENVLWLDDGKYTGHQSHIGKIDTFVVVGDLNVNGSIINNGGDYGISLIVLGNVSAKNIIFGGSNVFISGDVKVSGYAVAFYNHGWSKIEGTTEAKAVINHNNRFGGEYAKGMQILAWGRCWRRMFGGLLPPLLS